MWVDNLEDFGFLINAESFDITKKHPEFYEIYNNQFAWALRYVHEQYKEIFGNKTGVLREVCLTWLQQHFTMIDIVIQIYI